MLYLSYDLSNIVGLKIFVYFIGNILCYNGNYGYNLFTDGSICPLISLFVCKKNGVKGEFKKVQGGGGVSDDSVLYTCFATATSLLNLMQINILYKTICNLLIGHQYQ